MASKGHPQVPSPQFPLGPGVYGARCPLRQTGKQPLIFKGTGSTQRRSTLSPDLHAGHCTREHCCVPGGPACHPTSCQSAAPLGFCISIPLHGQLNFFWDQLASQIQELTSISKKPALGAKEAVMCWVVRGSCAFSKRETLSERKSREFLATVTYWKSAKSNSAEGREDDFFHDEAENRTRSVW